MFKFQFSENFLFSTKSNDNRENLGQTQSGEYPIYGKIRDGWQKVKIPINWHFPDIGRPDFNFIMRFLT